MASHLTRSPAMTVARYDPAMRANRISICRWLLPAFLLGGIAGATAARADAEALLVTCVQCHGWDGLGNSPHTPFLNGQTLAYLTESLALLQTGKRPTEVNGHIPADWGPAQRALVANHYAGLDFSVPPAEVDAAQQERGRQIFFEKCEACHEDGGRATDYRGTGSPILAGQKLHYLRSQIRAYLSGRRSYLVDMKRQAFRGAPLTVNSLRIGERRDPVSVADAEALAHFLAGNVRAEPKPSRRRSR